mmetsp:Transcript_1232/g.1861  ORF Transcript_1232/g.1861 Transcript_1232/m.1861 type:complete len:522 (+) Transcript_1232:300-1865(+)
MEKSSNNEENSLDVDLSDSEDDEDIVYMQKFVSGQNTTKKSGVSSSSYTPVEGEQESATRKIEKDFREQKKKAATESRRQKLLESTKQNFSALKIEEQAEDIDKTSVDAQDNDISLLSEAELAAMEEPERKFVELFKQGQIHGMDGDFETSLLCYEKANQVCTEFQLQKWAAKVNLSLGKLKFELGDVRESIAYYVTSLQQTQSRKLQLSILKELAAAYADIGRLQDAHDAREKIKELESGDDDRNEHGQVFTGKVPEALAASMDQALETAIGGSFGALRALLFAFRQGRGNISINMLTSYQHRKTKASPLMCAAARGDEKLVIALLQFGAPLDQTAVDGSNALTWACKFDQPAIAELLLARGAQFDEGVNTEDMSSWSPRVQDAISNFIQRKKVDMERIHAEISNRTLEEQVEHDKNWDQFHGKKSTFNENLYTTALNIDDIPEHVKTDAEKIAKEIEKQRKQSSSKKNDNMDEEYSYAAVLKGEQQDSTTDSFTDASISNKQAKLNEKRRRVKKKGANK